MRLLFVFIFVYGLIIFNGHIAMSQTVEGMNAASIKGDWVIEPHVNKAGVPSGNCTMTAEFDNGVSLSFKSDDGKLSALRVNGFSNESIKPIGFIGIGFDGDTYGLQSRSMPHQIDASLLTVPAPAQAIIGLEQFSVKIGADDYLFSTFGFQNGYNQLMTCEKRHGGTKMAVVSDPIYVRRGEELKEMMPANPVMPVLGQDLEGLEPIGVIGNDRTDANKSLWVAEKGERLETILKRWTDEEGVKLLVDVGKNPIITNDFSFEGDLNTAVNLLISENPNLQGLNTTVQDDVDVRAVATTIDNQQIASANANNQKQSPNDNWRALQGTNLRKVLTRWAQKENIDFVWDADQEFYIRKSVKTDKDFNSVVAEILNQFDGQKVRPMATLNTDPATGKTALIISVKEST